MAVYALITLRAGNAKKNNFNTFAYALTMLVHLSEDSPLTDEILNNNNRKQHREKYIIFMINFISFAVFRQF